MGSTHVNNSQRVCCERTFRYTSSSVHEVAGWIAGSHSTVFYVCFKGPNEVIG